VAMGKHILGICRGAQLCCVMAGGKLVQHQKNSGRHEITYRDSADGVSRLMVVSDHHQAQFPWGLGDGAKVLAWTHRLSPFHENGNQEEMLRTGADGGRSGIEVEDVYYPKTKALAVQTHPEWLDPHDTEEARTIAHYRKLLTLHLTDSL
jgi:gamma-glutamyl-gamma-aminobutyrate hydrolase PuuD